MQKQLLRTNRINYTNNIRKQICRQGDTYGRANRTEYFFPDSQMSVDLPEGSASISTLPSVFSLSTESHSSIRKKYELPVCKSFTSTYCNNQAGERPDTGRERERVRQTGRERERERPRRV